MDKKTKEKKQKYKNLKRSFLFYKKHLKLFILIVILSLVGSGVGMLSPVFTGQMVNYITLLDFNNVLIYAGLTLAVAILLQILYFVWVKVLITLNSRVKVDIKKTLITRLVGLKTVNFDKTNSGVYISRVNKDANELSTFYNSAVDCLAEIIANIGFLIYLMFINVWVGLFLAVEIVTIFLIENKRIKLLYKNRKKWKEADEKVVGAYGEIIRGVRDIKVLNLKENAIEVASQKQNHAILLAKKLDNDNNNWTRTRVAVMAIFDFLLIAFCLLLIYWQQLVPATLFIVYIYKGRIKNLVTYVINIKQHMTDGELAAERVFEILESEKFEAEKFGTKTLEKLSGEIEFNNVSFSYDKNEKLFEDLNFKILCNQTVGIVGKSGQGKSTILGLIDRLYEVNSGQILIDGVDIKELTEKSLRQNISIVMQTPYIFNTSILQNFQLVKPDVTLEELIEVCKKAQIHDFIETLPKGYESIVGENGVVLSGGQRQRLAIARALLNNSKIILFDEATSALDNESQGKIKLAIDQLKKDHTIIIVAHRLSTVVDCDNILVLNENKIVAQGKHKDLIKKCKIYKELYEIEENN